MKWRGKYLVWILLVLLVLLIASFWNSREHLESQKCWGPEEPMSAKTGYIDFSKGDSGMPITYDETVKYLKYVREQQQGNIDSGYDKSPDMVKGYCSTANCSAIYVRNGNYRPLMAPLIPTSPVESDGTPVPDSGWISMYKLIIPRKCAPPPLPPPASASATPDTLLLPNESQPPRKFTCVAS
jgi:hypothetical protein